MVTTPKKQVPQLTLEQLAGQIRAQIKKSTDSTLIKGVHTNQIPREEITVLALYLGKGLISKIFGGSQQAVTNMVNHTLKQRKEAEIDEMAHQAMADKPDDSEDKKSPSDPTPVQPLGIGGYRYANRLTVKIVRQLEVMVDSGAIGQGQQAVQASKALLEHTKGIKREAQNVMLAYEKQLVALAEHLVEKFLPAVSEKVKADFKHWKDEVLDEVLRSIPGINEDSCNVWTESIERFARQFDLKKFELMMAESLAENQKTSEAFNITEELVKNYGGEDDGAAMAIEGDDVKTIREAQAQAEEFSFNDEDLEGI